MSRASCADCDWEADAPNTRAAISLLERHIADKHNTSELEF